MKAEEIVKMGSDTLKSTKEYVVNYPNNFVKDTPKWAKVCRNIGIICTAAGAGIIASPALFPAGLVVAAGYLTAGGTFATLIFQGYKKTQ